MSRCRDIFPSEWDCTVVCTGGTQAHADQRVITTFGLDVSVDWINNPSFLLVHQSPSGHIFATTPDVDFISSSPVDQVREDIPRDAVDASSGTKLRLRCCGLDVPVSWVTLDRIVPVLHENDVRRIELSHLAAIVDGNRCASS